MTKKRKKISQYIPDTHHAIVAGRTGSGKSELLYAYTSGYEHVAVLDVKAEFTFGGYVLKDDMSIITRLADLDRVDTPKIVYRPHFSEMTLDHFSEFYMWCYNRENTVAVSDELLGICIKGQLPEGLKAIMTRGRSKHVPHWGATQRPSGIPLLTMSEASHFFVYDLNMPEDRKRLYDVTGASELRERPNLGQNEEFNFWYYTVKDEGAIKCRLVMKD